MTRLSSTIIALIVLAAATLQPVRAQEVVEEAPPVAPAPGTESEATATESSAPVREQPVPVRVPSRRIIFSPPLSIDECRILVQRGAIMLNEEFSPEGVAVNREDLKRMVTAVGNYLQFRNDLHSNLAFYRWVILPAGKVEQRSDLYETDIREFRPPVDRISAIRFEVQNSDAYVRNIRVYNSFGEMSETFIDPNYPHLFRNGLPRKDVYHLWKQGRVGRIEIDFARANPSPEAPAPRLTVEVGITDREEHIKVAIYRLREAARFIDEDRMAVVREHLTEADAAMRRHVRENSRR